MDLALQHAWALVTGGASGIGQRIVRAFLQEGARVVVADCDAQQLERTLQACTAEFGADAAIGCAVDILQSPDTLREFVLRHPGQLDHLICNVGSGRSVPPLQEDAVEFQRMLDINLVGAVKTVNILMPILSQSPASDKTRSITFIGSICGVEALGCPVAYAAAKAALVAYAKNIARPLGAKGVRVNVVSPGNILFPGSTWENKLTQDHQAVEGMLNREVPLQRFGTAEEVANVVVFLASQRAGFVTGANWIVDGGQTRGL